jgi:hypothetical protein
MKKTPEELALDAYMAGLNAKKLAVSDNKLIAWNAVAKSRTKEEWKNIGKSISKTKLTISKNQADEIWLKLWGEDRGLDLYKKLSLEYNVAYDAVMQLALGQHQYSPVNKEQWNKIHDHWHNLYGHNKNIYIIRSPGNNLLDYYDFKNLQRDTKKISKLSPSEIFDIRFRWKDKSRKLIKEFCDSKGIKVDGAMYDTYRSKTMRWLVDSPHQEWKFDNFIDMSKWICDKTNKQFKGGGQIAHSYIEREMIWQDYGNAFNGWSFLKEDKI